jgi:excinuclease ABC subunit A
MRASHRLGRQGYFYYQLEKLADRLHFNLNTPISKLPEEIVNIILYGDQDFEGVISNLERRWKESTSDFAKQEIEKYMHHSICKTCKGKRLKQEALSILIDNKNISDVSSLTIEDALKYFEELKNKLNPNEKTIATPILKEIISRLKFLNDVSLEYLSLSRESTTLSGGEAQRIRLATQISSGLSGIIYVLDEPSIGLHPRDQERLIHNLKRLRDLQNTVIVVEHDSQTILAADWVIEVGPGAGKHGGEIVFEGTPKELLKSNSLTGKYLSGKLKIDLLEKTKDRGNGKFITIKHANKFNLKDLNISFPLGKMIGITGVSGSGKSTLTLEVLYNGIINYFRSIGKIGYLNLDNDNLSSDYKSH